MYTQKNEHRITARPGWMTQELIDETARVWSATLGRRVCESEAVEMLQSVKRLVELVRRSGRTAT